MVLGEFFEMPFYQRSDEFKEKVGALIAGELGRRPDPRGVLQGQVGFHRVVSFQKSELNDCKMLQILVCR